MRPNVAPPTWMRRLLSACLPPEDRHPLLAELDAMFAVRLREGSRWGALRWYARQTAGFVLRVGSLRVGGQGLDRLRGDMRDAWRAIRSHKAFAITFVATMAIATGVLTTVYSAARRVLLRPVPGVTAEDLLVTIRLGSAQAPAFVSWEVSHPDYLTLRERLPLNGMLAARTPIDVDVRAGERDPRRVTGEMVTANYFTVVGARLAAGRGFLPEEDDAGAAEPVAVLSHAMARRLAAPPESVVGSDIVVNGRVVRVVGITVPGFRGVDLPGVAELWMPVSTRAVLDPTAATRPLSARGMGVWRLMVGRLPVMASVEQVAAAADATVDAVRAESGPHSYLATHQVLQVFPGIGLDPSVRVEVRSTLAQLGGAALLLLLLAIANLANLTMIESMRRQAATAVRVALGADRLSIARQALVEAAVLGLLSAAVALGLAVSWAGWFQDAQLSEHGGALAGMGVDVPAIAVAIVTAWAAATLVWLRPALLAGRSAMETLVHRNVTGARSGNRLRATLVSVQVALSMVLLVAAGLLGRTVSNLRAIDLGFEPDRLLTFAADPHLHGHESAGLARIAATLENDLTQASGVNGAGFVSPSPLVSSYLTAALYGSDDPEARPLIAAGYYVSAGFLPALGLRLIAGEEPWRGDSGTAVLSRRTIAELYPGVPVQAVIGRLVPTRRNRGGRVRVAGVIDDIRLSDITADPPPVMFRPLAERPAGLTFTGFVQGARPSSLVPSIRRAVAARAPDLPLYDTRTARESVDLQFAERDAMARAAFTLSGLGLLLAAVGLYGVLAAMVAARRREIGVRSALGAAPGMILRRVLATGLAPVAIGAIGGVVGAVAVGRLLAAQLFGLPPLDVASFFLAAGALAVAALLATLVPAWRATQVSPAEVLREE